jgi:hypothetical protein
LLLKEGINPDTAHKRAWDCFVLTVHRSVAKWIGLAFSTEHTLMISPHFFLTTFVCHSQLRPAKPNEDEDGVCPFACCPCFGGRGRTYGMHAPSPSLANRSSPSMCTCTCVVKAHMHI